MGLIGSQVNISLGWLLSQLGRQVYLIFTIIDPLACLHSQDLSHELSPDFVRNIITKVPLYMWVQKRLEALRSNRQKWYTFCKSSLLLKAILLFPLILSLNKKEKVKSALDIGKFEA